MGGLVPDQPHIPLCVQGGVFYVRIINVVGETKLFNEKLYHRLQL